MADTPPSKPDSPGEQTTALNESALTQATDVGRVELAPNAVPGFTLLRKLASGGQGDVYLALQESPRRKVAIKFIRRDRLTDAADLARFEREIDVLARLRHPNIVAIHASGQCGDSRYFVMDYVGGHTLEQWAASQESSAKSPRSVIAMFVKICRAVAAAHASGITHRDLKPQNIRVGDDGAPAVLDFGLAKLATSEGGVSSMTMTGLFVGSVPWSSPEQAEGANSRIDIRSDVYSLGVVLYQLLTGAFPHDMSGDRRQVLDRIATQPPISPRKIRPDLDPDLETIVLRCLAKERDRRYRDAGELADDLENVLADRPIAARRDSIVQLLRSRLFPRNRRRWLLPHLLILGVSAGAGVLAPLLLWKTGIDEKYREWLLKSAGPAIAPPRIEQVRLIELSSDASVTRMAQSFGLSDVKPEDRQSHRRLHGRLLEKLANSGVRVVAFDYRMRTESQFDADFVRGVEALAASPSAAEVVIGTPSWSLTTSRRPEVSPVILEAGVRWGPLKFDPTPPNWALEIVLQAKDDVPRANLSLTTLAAFREPRATEVRYRLLEEPVAVEVTYFDRDSKLPSLMHRRPRVDVVRLTAWPPWQERLSQNDWMKGETLGILQIMQPEPDVLKGVTYDYEAVLRATDGQCREWFADRAVLVGDARPGSEDWCAHPAYGNMPGCRVHAAGIEQLLTGLVVQTTSAELGTLLALVAASIGLGVGACLYRRWIPRLGGILILTLLVVSCSFLTYRVIHFLSNPLGPWIASVAACELAAAARREQVARLG